MLLEQELIDNYITILYRLLLKRDPDQPGFQYWRKYIAKVGLQGFGVALTRFVESDEYKSLCSSPSKDFEAIDTYLIALYRHLLKREPDEEGFKLWRDFIVSAGLDGFSLALTDFAESSEFKSLYITNDSYLERYKQFDFSKVSSQKLNALFEKTAVYWKTIASTPEELYWSVLTNENYKGILSNEQISKFLKTGKGSVSKIQKICRKINYNFRDCKEFLDYGCGVGRLVVNLPESIEKINCVDFSSTHLAEAERNLLKARPEGLGIHLIESIHDLEHLPKNQDIVHSSIVLQHNTPPIIETTIDSLLGVLVNGGIAILHVPLARAFYEFDVDEYLASDICGKSMEMHILPKENLHQLARKQHCEIVYSFCDGGCGGDIYSETVVFRKQNHQKLEI